jgi:hypothetical protein
MTERMAKPGDMAAEEPEDEQQTDLYVTMRALMAEVLAELGAKGHDHHWTTLGANMPTKPSTPFSQVATNVLLKCTICGLPQSISLVGSWEESQVKKTLDS